MTLDNAPTSPGTYRPIPHGAALLSAAFTLPLLFLGGSVTSYGVGLAVPDWPTTFGINMFLYDFWHEPFGVKLEHTHRLYGAAVGLTTLALAASLLLFDRRRSVKALGVVAVLAVILQGIMGGLRVNQISTLLAAVHGAFGQAFFGLMVVLCVLTGRDWIRAPDPRPDPAHIRPWSALTLLVIYSQTLLGAWFRHFGSTAALLSHIVMAVAVWVVATSLAVRLLRRRAEIGPLRAPALALGLAVSLQVALGILALWLILPLGGNPRTPTLWMAMTRTAHQTNGALLLAAAIVTALRASRHLRPAPAPSPTMTPQRRMEAMA